MYFKSYTLLLKRENIIYYLIYKIQHILLTGLIIKTIMSDDHIRNLSSFENTSHVKEIQKVYID